MKEVEALSAYVEDAPAGGTDHAHRQLLARVGQKEGKDFGDLSPELVELVSS